MGCTTNSDVSKTTNKLVKTPKLKFEKRPYVGEETEGTLEVKKAIEMYKDVPKEHLLVTEATVENHRENMWQWIIASQEKEKEFLDAQEYKVDRKDEWVTVKDGTQIYMYVYRSKTLKSQSAPAYFYAHGGGAYALDASMNHGYLSHVASNLECVIFNINYRKGPEVKAPVGQQDFVDSINHVLANAATYGIDPKKCGAAGVSGGGWILCGAANLLAKANDLRKIKALFFETGMLSNSSQDIPEDQHEPYEKYYGATPDGMTAMYKLHATDWDNQQKDDQLFPGRTSDDILKQYPPTVVWTSEHDFLRRDNEVFAKRLEGVGKLAALSSMPGVTHGYHGMHWESQQTKWFHEELKLAFKQLVVDN